MRRPWVPQLLTIYGATNVSVTVPTHSGSTGGMSGGDVIVTFTVTTVPNAPAGAVFMLWGGHIAQSAYWKTTAGLPNGAGQM